MLLVVSTVTITIDRQPAVEENTADASDTVNCSLQLQGTGPVSIVDGLVFQHIDLSFDLINRTDWSLSGAVAAAVFECDCTLAASLEQTAEMRTVKLATTITADEPLVRLDG